MLGYTAPENYMSSSMESLNHNKLDKARKMLERDFNDDEYYFVTGSAPIRHHGYANSSRTRVARPRDYTDGIKHSGLSGYKNEDDEEKGGSYSRHYEDRENVNRFPNSSPDGYRGGEHKRYSSINQQAPERSRVSTSSTSNWKSGNYPGEDRTSFGGRRDYDDDLPNIGNISVNSSRDHDDTRNERNTRGDDKRNHDEAYKSKQNSTHSYNGGRDYKDRPLKSSASQDVSGGRDNTGMKNSRSLRSESSRYDDERPTDRSRGQNADHDARTTSRQSSRLLFDGEEDAKLREKQFYENSILSGKQSGEKEFLGKVQRELEHQRSEWKGEIDRLTSSSLMPGSGSTYDVVKNSVVDTSSGRPVFKAFIDVSEFPAASVKVNVDKLTNKVVIEAQQVGKVGTAKTFTQRVQLPRYADEQSLVARMNKNGILKVEVPLLYYFPEVDGKTDTSKAGSFVYEVRTDPKDGSKVMEILVSTGRDMTSRELRVGMDGDKLQIWSEKAAGSVGSLSPAEDAKKVLIKQYTMPPNADVNAIRTRRTKDGRYAVLVPLL